MHPTSKTLGLFLAPSIGMMGFTVWAVYWFITRQYVAGFVNLFVVMALLPLTLWAYEIHTNVTRLFDEGLIMVPGRLTRLVSRLVEAFQEEHEECTENWDCEACMALAQAKAVLKEETS